ncbi:MAG: hypothetical protein JWN65_2942 [Solirubrobacterales bacterium]|nr:hypothetical protein [Solirubrobacterales bacterium]
MSHPRPVVAVLHGLVAGAIGTAAMDLVLYSRFRRGGGESGFADWELSRGLTGWDEAPAPAQVGRRLVEGVFGREVPGERAALTNDLMHWAYGTSWGAAYGIVAGSFARPPTLRSGLAFGSVVWAGDYVILPLAGLYEPIWKYDARTLADDLSAHLVFGVVTATTFRLLRAVSAPPRARGCRRQAAGASATAASGVATRKLKDSTR